MTEADLDPRWAWADVTMMGDPGPRFIKAGCKHLTPVPVQLSLTGETVAMLCPDCDLSWDA